MIPVCAVPGQAEVIRCENCPWDCPSCGWPVNPEILAETADCPHGWSSFEGMNIADIKAAFAAGAPELSVDPQ